MARANSADVPVDVALVIEMLSSGDESAASNRRKFIRARHVARAALQPVRSGSRALRRTIYTRDANQWGVGFITQERITVGEEVTLHIADPSDPAAAPLELRCGILRCREVLPGWYEGAALLTAEEPRLSPEAIAAAAR
jgi:hypothetical protein